MINTTQRMEKLRRARSLNDVLSLSNAIGKDITKACNIYKVLGIGESTSAVLKFNHAKLGEVKKPSRVKIGPKIGAPSKMGAELASFKAPPLKQVLQHSAVIHSLQENLHELEAAAATIRTTFNRAKNQSVALKGVLALVKEARATLEGAYNSLSFIAQKHLPPEMTLLGEEMRTFLIDNLERKNYSNLSTRVYVTAGEEPTTSVDPHKDFTKKRTIKADLPAKKTAKEKAIPTKDELQRDIIFAFYIDIEDLRDSSGAIISHYYVILTGVIGKTGHIRYFLTTLPDFRAPGMYSPGAQVETSEEMVQRLVMLLATNDITSTIEKKPMPINTKDADARGFNTIENVERTYVADDSLWVVLKKGLKGKELDKAADKVVNQVFPLLNAAVGNARRTKSVIKYKPPVMRAGKPIIQFFLTPNVKTSAAKTQVNAEQLAELQEQLGLESGVMDDIKKVLKRHL